MSNTELAVHIEGAVDSEIVKFRTPYALALHEPSATSIDTLECLKGAAEADVLHVKKQFERETSLIHNTVQKKMGHFVLGGIFPAMALRHHKCIINAKTLPDEVIAVQANLLKALSKSNRMAYIDKCKELGNPTLFYNAPFCVLMYCNKTEGTGLLDLLYSNAELYEWCLNNSKYIPSPMYLESIYMKEILGSKEQR